MTQRPNESRVTARPAAVATACGTAAATSVDLSPALICGGRSAEMDDAIGSQVISCDDGGAGARRGHYGVYWRVSGPLMTPPGYRQSAPSALTQVLEIPETSLTRLRKQIASFKTCLQLLGFETSSINNLPTQHFPFY